MADIKTPKVGDLWHRITIETPQKTVDEDGTPATGWTTLISVWASVVLLKPSKITPLAERASATDAYQIDVRSLEVPSNARIRWGDKTLYVHGSGDVWDTGAWTRIWADNHQGDRT